jgi:uncharacterized Ntn-hydrolase superfamily protein
VARPTSLACMTFSIVATDGAAGGREQAWGVAVASKFLAAGAVVPEGVAGVGAIATQAHANLTYRPDGLTLLRNGMSAQETLDRLTAGDDQRDERQAGVVDAGGGAATFTGSECKAWAGGVTGRGPSDGDVYAIQGNILTGPEVVAEMERAWRTSDPAAPLARRLLAALVAGDDAGGDSRGRQSAALLVVTPGGGYGGGSDVFVDLRVDDHERPIPELGRVLDLHDVIFGKPRPDAALPLEDEIATEVRDRLARLGHTDPTADGPGLDRALADWAGVENYEERMLPGRIDVLVLAQLRLKTP